MGEYTKIFINNVNTYVGTALVDIFKTDDTEEENPAYIIGTMKEIYSQNDVKSKHVKK